MIIESPILLIFQFSVMFWIAEATGKWLLVKWATLILQPDKSGINFLLLASSLHHVRGGLCIWAATGASLSSWVLFQWISFLSCMLLFVSKLMRLMSLREKERIKFGRACGTWLPPWLSSTYLPLFLKVYLCPYIFSCCPGFGRVKNLSQGFCTHLTRFFALIVTFLCIS